MDFSFDFSIVTWILLALIVPVAFLGLWGRYFPIWKAGSAVKPADRSDHPTGPKASVIVYSTSEEEELTGYLEQLMTQDYPDYEVILVNEGNAETTAHLAERLLKRWPQRLYVTFTPMEVHNLSRRKLALTIGMKAAHGEVVAITTANAVIPSRSWLSDLLAPFSSRPGTDVVLGYSHIDFREMHGLGKWYRSMDYTFTSCMWIGAAAECRPYRGDGMNLALRKHLFFDHKGFARTIHMVNGDDDLFLNEIMTPGNTVLSITPDNILTMEWESSANRVLSDIKERYAFTSRFLPRRPFLRAGFGSAMQWATVGLAIAASVTGLPSLLPLIIAVGLTGASWLAEIIIYRRTAGRLGSPRLWWALPWLSLWHPLGNALFRQRHRHVRKHYTFR